MTCPWCDLEYDLTPQTEKTHLLRCDVYQNLPVAEITPSGKIFVALPSNPNILVERVRIQ